MVEVDGFYGGFRVGGAPCRFRNCVFIDVHGSLALIAIKNHHFLIRAYLITIAIALVFFMVTPLSSRQS